ncbi:hypothetical protein OHT57_44255 [Streptomyces sp. NBC_00285]|uniref:hypothetical protein n=1 Tax=Streptomyces sp. NBC_00285 TaxID=2975700 RepID=UPI002E2C9DC7|nr:hypothetical protein [Streptomyces sp. NBC_00285]
MHVTGHKDEAGLSCSTTSRIVDGHASVNEETQEQAQAVVEPLACSGGATARAPFGSMNRSAGLLVSDIALAGRSTTRQGACSPPPPASGGDRDAPSGRVRGTQAGRVRDAQTGAKVTTKQYVTAHPSDTAGAGAVDDLAAVAIGIPPPTPPPAEGRRSPSRSAAPRSPASSRTPATGI